jgi:hypothetical protein
MDRDGAAGSERAPLRQRLFVAYEVLTILAVMFALPVNSTMFYTVVVAMLVLYVGIMYYDYTRDAGIVGILASSE